jgi:hypothetical protein
MLFAAAVIGQTMRKKVIVGGNFFIRSLGIMFDLLPRSWPLLWVVFWILGLPGICRSEGLVYPWTYLVPEHDSRDSEVADFDEYLSKCMTASININEARFFHGNLTWQKVPIARLLSTRTPFCELEFDAMRPLILTPAEKSILREYLARGGFILLSEDAYPYSQDEFWTVKEWPVIDFMTKELSAADPNFTFGKITPSHFLFHAVYTKTIGLDIIHEIEGNPNTPRLLLVSYRGHPCAFVIGQYTDLINNKWYALPRPFPRPFEQDPEGYAEIVNLYIYVMTH